MAIINSKKDELLEKYRIRIDKVGRMYTVINLPPQTDTYGPKDGPRITKALLQSWLNNFDNYLINIGVKELTRVEQLQEIDESNYLLVLRYKYFNLASLATSSIIISSILLFSTIILILIKLIF